MNKKSFSKIVIFTMLAGLSVPVSSYAHNFLAMSRADSVKDASNDNTQVDQSKDMNGDSKAMDNGMMNNNNKNSNGMMNNGNKNSNGMNNGMMNNGNKNSNGMNNGMMNNGNKNSNGMNNGNCKSGNCTRKKTSMNESTKSKSCTRNNTSMNKSCNKVEKKDLVELETKEQVKEDEVLFNDKELAELTEENLVLEEEFN